MERATVHVNGVVQSVGFRPFVYGTAVDLDLTGMVRNLGDAGVRIELEGAEGSIEAFLTRLRTENPPLAEVSTVEVDRESVADSRFESFEIVPSAGGDGGGGTIPPDTAMCEACLADMRDPSSRYHDYWATACVDCGPRFTVIEGLPYDRPETSMAAFPMCEDCRAEYEDPADRRYHAQAIACPQCGPMLSSLADVEVMDRSAAASIDDGTDPVSTGVAQEGSGTEALDDTADALRTGAVVVVKGIGGAHLACDATDPDAVARLRERTGRPEKPFAVMAADRAMAEELATVPPAEREELMAQHRPILLLDEREDSPVAHAVSPGLHTIGVMLPYSGAHHLLFDRVDHPLVLTSANRPGRPMHVQNADIVAALDDVADGFLLHDRRIVSRCDDSVARFVDGDRRLVRRSRGFVPKPVPMPGLDGSVLALGPALDVTVGILSDGDCYLTQYIGDVDDVATAEYLDDAIANLQALTGLDDPRVVAHDRHPKFLTTDRATELVGAGDVEHRVPVQHHHAHAASVLAEHDRDRAIAITIDGVGYGDDGAVWGGEVLDARLADAERVGSLAPVPMPGGDRATRYPVRLVAGLIAAHADVDAARAVLDDLDGWLPGGAEERDVVCQQLAADVNVPETTSAGRFLDAVSALLGVCQERTYEGEPAMKLEAVAARGDPVDLSPSFTALDDRRVLDTPTLFASLRELRAAGHGRADVAATAQEVLAHGLADLAIEAARERNQEVVALSGGVAYNDHVAATIRSRVHDAALSLLGNEQVPAGDGGIAYGQAAVAAARRPDEP